MPSNEPCTFDSPLGDDVVVVRMNGVEGVSELFRFDVEVAVHDGDVKFDALIGQGATIRIPTLETQTRYINGIISRVVIGAGGRRIDTDLVTYHLEIVPAMWKLTRRTDCRVWENKNVVDILNDVFGLSAYALQHEIKGPSTNIEYCVQYRETDFHFASRMMEEWGLSYRFEHEDGNHKLVVFDDSTSCPFVPGVSEVKVARSAGDGLGNAEVASFCRERLMPSGHYTLDDYDFKEPSFAQSESCAPMHLASLTNTALEIYEYPGKCPDGFPERAHELRIQAEEAAAERGRGESRCAALTAGCMVTLKESFRDDFDGDVFLTRIEHQFSGTEGGVANYENHFDCLSKEMVYRPARVTAKPIIQGSQTAIVVGPSNEEIHCDKYGRIRIQFHWDRYGPGDGQKVCWARVLQGSAGKKWGTVFTPRIGQEVLVTFLEGDPDRPLVTGVVYNGEQMPPYELPVGKTQSGIKSRSSKGGGADNFNEIRMEDKKGSEELFMQAEKNMTVKVKASRSETVGGAISTSAGGSISRKAFGDISRHTDANINDKATSNIVTESGGSMNLTSAGSYMLKTNLGIQLQAINFVFQALESGAKAAADALKSAAGAAGGLPTAANEAAAAGSAAQAEAEMAATVTQGAMALSAFVDSQATSEGAAKVEGAAADAAAASQSFAAAVAAGDGAAIAESAVALAAAAGEAYTEAKAMVEAMISMIPSIALWAMKDITGYALWNISLTSKLKDISLTAARGNVSVSAKKEVGVVSETKNVAIEAKKEKLFVKAEKEIVLECGKAKLVLMKDGTVKLNGEQIELKAGGDIKLKGKSVSEN